jgi:SOS-response transcriptional repressor LexA
MPHALTDRQREFLQYIREFVQHEESSPRLEDIAGHFGVKPPTAHKMLEALQSKGYLYFGRDKVSGFFIRLIERAGSAEIVSEIPIAGRFDALGELHDFPNEIGHFATVTTGTTPGNMFALAASADLPQANILNQDLIIFDMSKRPQPGDICIAPIGERLFLIKISSKTFDRNTVSLEMAQQYPIPADLTHEEYSQQLHWYPLAYDDVTGSTFEQIARDEQFPFLQIPQHFVLATALRLVRFLAF